MGRRNQQLLQTLAKQEETSKAAVNAILSRDEKMNAGNIHEAIASEARKVDQYIVAGYIETHVMPKHRAALVSIKQGKTDADLRAAGFSDSIVENARKQHIRDVVDEKLELKTREADHAERSDNRKKILEAIELNTNKHDGSLVTNPFNKDEHKEALYLPGEDDGIQAAARLVAILQAHKPELHDSLKAKERDYQNILAKVDEEIKKAIDDLYGTSGSLNPGKITDGVKQRKLSVIIKKFKEKDLSLSTASLTVAEKQELIDAFGKSDAVNAAIEKIFETQYSTSGIPAWATVSKGQYKAIVKLSAEEVFGIYLINDNNLKTALGTVINSSGTLNIPTTPAEAQYKNRMILKLTDANASALARVLKEITEDSQSITAIETALNDYRLITAEQAVEHHLKGTPAGATIATAIGNLIQADGSLVKNLSTITLSDSERDAIQQLIFTKGSIEEAMSILGSIVLDVAKKGEVLPDTSLGITFLMGELLEGAFNKYAITDTHLQELVKALVQDNGTVRNLKKADLTADVINAIKTMLGTNTVGGISTTVKNALKYVAPSSDINTKEIILSTIVKDILVSQGITGNDIQVIAEIIITYFVNDNGEVIDPASVKLLDAATQEKLQKIVSGSTATVKADNFDKILELINPSSKVDFKEYKKFFTTIVYTEADYRNGIATAAQFCVSNIVKLPANKISDLAKINRSVMWQKPIIGWLDQLIGKLEALDGTTLVVDLAPITDFVKQIQTALAKLPEKILCMTGEAIYNGINLQGELAPFYLKGGYVQLCKNLQSYKIMDPNRIVDDLITDMKQHKTHLTESIMQETNKMVSVIGCKISSGDKLPWTLDHTNIEDVQNVLSENGQVCTDGRSSPLEFCPEDITNNVAGLSVLYNETLV
jgi:hypothetical protein